MGRRGVENRLAEGSIDARLAATVRSFGAHDVELAGADGAVEGLAADAVYVLIGYEPDMHLLAAAGVRIDGQTLVPSYDAETCESNVAGLFIAGTLQAGRDTVGDDPRRAAASGKSAQSERTLTVLVPSKPVSRCLT